MAQELGALVTPAEELDSIPGTNTVAHNESEVLFWPLQANTWCAHSYKSFLKGGSWNYSSIVLPLHAMLLVQFPVLQSRLAL